MRTPHVPRSAALFALLTSLLPGCGSSQLYVPQVVSSANTLDFGTVATGAQKELAVSVSNLGSGPVKISVAVTGAPGFRYLGPASISLNDGSATELAVAFSAADVGAATGSLVLNWSDNSTSSVSLSAVAVDGGI